jgi:hypothetical protein
VSWGEAVGAEQRAVADRKARLAGVGILALVADEVADRKAAMVVAVNGLAVPLAPFEGVEQPSPAELMFAPLRMSAADQVDRVGGGWHQKTLLAET